MMSLGLAALGPQGTKTFIKKYMVQTGLPLPYVQSVQSLRGAKTKDPKKANQYIY